MTNKITKNRQKEKRRRKKKTFSIRLSEVCDSFTILTKGSITPSASIVWQTPLLHQKR
jgi:hypothetical protein